MTLYLQILACGVLLLFTALASPVLQRLPVSTAMLYLGVGVAIGPLGLGWLQVDAVADAAWLETLAEVAVLVSLFVTGLKIDTRVSRAQWRVALRLASVTMLLTIAGFTLLGHFLLGLPWGLALVLGATLAPTDPVLASDIQVQSAEDRDALRVALSGEAGLNDGAAFPFVMLGLGWMGLHDIGSAGWRWLAQDVVWAVAVGVGVGWAVGQLIGRAAARFKGWRPSVEPLSEFIAVGAIAASFGAAQALGGYGFLAVFFTGLAVRRGLELQAAQPEVAAESVGSVLQFNGQLERIVEFVLVIVVGAALAQVQASGTLLAFVAVALFIVRPLMVAATVPATVVWTGRDVAVSRRQRRLMGWFGIRGIGSLYYLAYAVQNGVAGAAAQQLSAAVLTLVAASVIVHGISVTPLMGHYDRRQRRDRATPGRGPAAPAEDSASERGGPGDSA
jgi:NhaP-type Na+/H+ or K+/H+ antiporter